MRLLKQIIYGFFIGVVFALLVWWVVGWFYHPVPTCFDNTQNQGETGVDCGGPCVSCEVKSLQPISILHKYIIPVPGGVGIVAELLNPNQKWGARSFSYTFILKDQFSNTVFDKTGSWFAYPGELTYLIIPRTSLASSSVASVAVTLDSPQWVSSDVFVKPNIEVQDMRTEYNKGVIVQATIHNIDTRSFSNVLVSALVFNHAGALIGASQTSIDSLSTLDSQNVKISFPQNLDMYQPVINASISFAQDVRAGDTGTDVQNLQSVLTEQGFYTGAISGFFDAPTQTALTAFQQKNNLAPTGILDSSTRSFLNALLQSETPQQTLQEKDTSVDATKTKVFVNVSL